ncbi:hypothetical protein [Lactobacillus selangorensis]|nr:hypothetical protein [Lactobacillus selangorensis]
MIYYLIAILDGNGEKLGKELLNDLSDRGYILFDPIRLTVKGMNLVYPYL